MNISDDALEHATDLIKTLLVNTKLDYSPYLLKIAKEIWDEGHWCGVWDITVTFDDLPALRAIQEDEWDQHMDDEDKPTWDKMIDSSPVYVWFADDTK